MTVRGGREPRRRTAGARRPGTRRPRFVDRGWDDYWPDDAEAAAARVGRIPDDPPRRGHESRDYRCRPRQPAPRSRSWSRLAHRRAGPGRRSTLRRPAGRLSAIADWGAENPTALNLPFVAGHRARRAGRQPDRAGRAPQDFRAVVFEIRYGETSTTSPTTWWRPGLIGSAGPSSSSRSCGDVTTDFLAGRHSLTRAMTVDQIIVVLTIPAVVSPTFGVTFREGLRIEQMVAKLELMEAKPDDPSAPLQMNVSLLRDGHASAGGPRGAVPVAEAARRSVAGGLPVPGHLRHRAGHHAAAAAGDAARRLRQPRPGRTC